MSKADFIPSADGAFNEWQNVCFTYIQAHKAAWYISDLAVSRVAALKTDFEAKFAIVENPATHTPVAVQAKNDARKIYEAELRTLIRSNVTYNQIVTDANRTAMRLPIHSTGHTPAPTPTTYPELEIDSSVIRRLIVHYKDNGKESKAKPAGVHGVEIRWAILSAPPARVNELVNSAFDTHTPYTLEFDENDRGKAVYLCLRWENTRGEKGPWSEIVCAFVP
jgi:hypothetical protein